MYTLREDAERSLSLSEPYLRYYGLTGILFPITSIYDTQIAGANYDTLPFRLLMMTVIIAWLFHDRFPKTLSAYKDIAWVSTVTFALPSSFGLMLVWQASLQTPGTEIHHMWTLQYVVSIFLLLQLTSGIRLTLIMWATSIAISFFPTVLLRTVNWDEVARVTIFNFGAYLTAVIAGSIANRNTHLVEAARTQVAAALGSTVAHELRTPLASIRLLARGTSKHLPELARGYQEAVRTRAIDAKINPNKVETIENILKHIENEVDYSSTMIDMLLLNTRTNPSENLESQEFYISTSIEDALRRFPFNNSQEKLLIEKEIEEDFQVWAPQLLVVHVLFNLIKNSVHHVQSAKQPKVIIKATSSQTRNLIEVFDNGPGISQSDLQKIFDRFYTTTKTGDGAGIGLSFCKMVMESIGGSIKCESVEGEYTLFTLTFPKV